MRTSAPACTALAAFVALTSLALPVLGGGAGCSSADVVPIAPPPPSSAPPTSTAVPPAAPLATIAFTPCSLQTGAKDTRAECANVEVPLDWGQPDGKKATLFVKRLLGTSAGPKKQLWLLAGGPGGAGDGMEPFANAIARRDDAVDIYMPDHRGTGRSTRLDCPATKKQGARYDLDACASEVVTTWTREGLATFTTTTAARDVGHLIDKTRAPDQAVHVYGVSYGTYWAQRYLQLFPDQAAAVTLDSVCQSGLCSLSKMGFWFDSIGKRYLAECAADAFCASKLGPDPAATVRAAIARADAGTCEGIKQLDAPTLRRIYETLIASFSLRVLVPATAYRIVRCDADDVAALQAFVTTLGNMLNSSSSSSSTPPLSSDVLGIHIALSELEEAPPPPVAALNEAMKDALFSQPNVRMRELYDTWPRYAHDAYVGQYPNTNAAMLLMNGTLDPQTPPDFADVIAPHYTKPSQSYVLFPRAAHGVIVQSPTGKPPADACGWTVWSQFTQAPTSALDTSCLAKILPHDFESSPTIASSFFGRPSLWQAPSLQAGALIKPLTPAVLAELGEALRDAELQTRSLHLGEAPLLR